MINAIPSIMATTPKVYVDNNDKIYFTDFKAFDQIKQSAAQLSLGLEDAHSLPGQSTWIINKVKFNVQVYTDYDTTDMANFPYGTGMIGICPYGITTTLSTVEDYQDIRGWPLAETWRSWSIPAPVSSTGSTSEYMLPMMRTSFSGTYTPKSTLALNRQQMFMMNVKNLGDNDCYGFMSLFISARRGE